MEFSVRELENRQYNKLLIKWMSSLELKFFNSGVFKEYSNEIKRIYRFENSNYLVTQLIFNSRVLKKKTIKTPWPSYFFLTGEVQTTFLSTDFIDTFVTR